MTPRPGSLRLITRAGGKPPRPPFGLAAWDAGSSDAVEGVAVQLAASEPLTTAGVAAQLPEAAQWPPGTPVVVLGAAAREGSLWRVFARAVAVSRAARCSALIARGYVDVGAGIDDASGADLAWGRVP